MDEKAGAGSLGVQSGRRDASGPSCLLRPGEGFIYAIGCADAKAVKIGHSMNTDVRLASLQSGNPFDLVLLAHAFTKTPYGDEQRLHLHLCKHHMRGEWFRAEPEVLEVVRVISESNHRSYIDALDLDMAPVREPNRRRRAGEPVPEFSWSDRFKRRKKPQ